jgi:hypothetical protein
MIPFLCIQNQNHVNKYLLTLVISRYTTFFSIISLVYFVLENLDKPGSEEILADANDGKAALNGLAMRSQAADRCSTALKVRTASFCVTKELTSYDRVFSTNYPID